MKGPAENVLGTIGDTPLIRLKRYLQDASVELHAKVEYANPGSSAKDRPAFYMLRKAIEKGDVTASSTIVESSSGNMGIGLAQACCYYGLPFICVVDPRAQEHNLAIMRAYGTRIELVKQPDADTGDFLVARVNRVRQLLQSIPNAYWPDQYANRANPTSHARGTIREIFSALDGRLDYLFVATSSTGTASGCQHFLKEIGSSAKVVAVDAAGSVLFGGLPGERLIPGMGAGRVSELAAAAKFDEVTRVTDLDCVVGCRKLVQREAILAGGSAGGVLAAIEQRVDALAGSTCVAILHDSGRSYLDTVYSDSWVEATLGCAPENLASLIAGYKPEMVSVAW
ncbi:MAG: 2,3-diaminopropionate biosynthesis protein SbnA [Lacipirellulaceae bacterium]